jgi:hypothetical protein
MDVKGRRPTRRRERGLRRRLSSAFASWTTSATREGALCPDWCHGRRSGRWAESPAPTRGATLSYVSSTGTRSRWVENGSASTRRRLRRLRGALKPSPLTGYGRIVLTRRWRPPNSRAGLADPRRHRPRNCPLFRADHDWSHHTGEPNGATLRPSPNTTRASPPLSARPPSHAPDPRLHRGGVTACSWARGGGLLGRTVGQEPSRTSGRSSPSSDVSDAVHGEKSSPSNGLFTELDET